MRGRELGLAELFIEGPPAISGALPADYLGLYLNYAGGVLVSSWSSEL